MSDMVQGSEEWLSARLGKVTASRVADLMAKTKTGPSASRASYMAELITERLTGTAPARFTNAAMMWGTETEPAAREAYAFAQGVTVTETGLVMHPTIADFGASPDGLADEDGLVEIKCPNTATHIETLLSDKVPSKYLMQMQTQMACTGREWCDFVSYDPRLPGEMQLWIKRVDRCDETISLIEEAVQEFLRELEKKLDALRARYMGEQS